MLQKSPTVPKLADWQPPAGKRVAAFSLARLDPAAQPWSLGDKESDKARVEALALELDALQDLRTLDHRARQLENAP